MLFLGTYPLPDRVDDPAPGTLFTAGFAAGLDGPQGGSYRKLFAAWLERRRDPAVIQAGLWAALSFGVEEAAPVARRVLADKQAPPRAIEQALLVLGHHGRARDLPVLLAFRTDDRPITTGFKPGGAPAGSLQVRDVATAMALKLSGQDFGQFGFEDATYQDWRVGKAVGKFAGVELLPTDDARAAAHKKAWAWLDAHPKPAPAP